MYGRTGGNRGSRTSRRSGRLVRVGARDRVGPARIGRAMLVAASLGSASIASGQQRLDPVTVTATRVEADPFDVPASIDRVDGGDVRAGRLQVNLSESLGVVPGLALQNRQNYAQDLQLSIRGFGARSTFGIRGVRVYVDGIPATAPDGQGQLTNIDLGSVDRIEVLRGPFSALYGNSSGGVLQAFTERGGGPLTVTPSFAVGSDATLRIGLKATGSVPLGTPDPADPTAAVRTIDYVVDGSHFETDGPRQHSAPTTTEDKDERTEEFGHVGPHAAITAPHRRRT